MPEGYHPPVEEYLEAVHELEEDNVPVIQARLAERLGHSAPTVSEMIRKLRDEGFVTIEGREISLTKEGQHRAQSVVRKHRLAERLLTDIIGLEWHKSHMEATRWEHVISEEVEQRLVQLLDDPGTCPHGNPIPGSARKQPKLVKMAEAQAGDSIRLERVTEQVEFDTPTLTYLGEAGFTPGAEATVTIKEADGSMVLDFGGKRIDVSGDLSQLLYIAS